MKREDSDGDFGTSVAAKNRLAIERMVYSRGESDRGRVLIVAAQIDSHLQEIIEAFLIKDRNVSELFDNAFAPLQSFSSKTKIAYFLGLITKSERDKIDAVRKVRNIFAHTIEASFEHVDVAKICGKPPVADGRQIARDAFFHMALNVIWPLLYREIKVRRDWRRSALSDRSASDP